MATERNSTVFTDWETMGYLREISKHRKAEKNPRWSQQNTVAELVKKEYKRIKRNERARTGR